MERAVAGYKSDVEAGDFPAEEHSHSEADLDDLY
jgi:3-methyl-2-oxobutanoate hydroxymethyltransferase